MSVGREIRKPRPESLIYRSAEEAQQFAERVEQRQTQEQQPVGVRDKRAAVAQELTEEFTKHGETADALKQPWEHTEAEHEEVQELVNVAFAQDLPAALRRARGSGHYPRNLDLLHDVLTNEMYEAMVKEKLNKQPVWGAVLALTTLFLLLFGAILIIVLVSNT